MEKWNLFLEEIRKNIGDQDFVHWFSPIQLNSVEESKIILTVPNETFKEVLQESFFNVLSNQVKKIYGQDFKVEIFSLEEKADSKTKWQSFLNPNYTFQNFVVGECNQFAHAAAKAVANSPAKAYNPLYIYGSTGLGKTHLMQAIGNFCAGKNKMKVLYVSVETFYTDLVNSLQNQKLIEFRNRYRKADILLLDDLQFLTGKKTTQDELFHLFNSLYESNKQLVLASDHLPKDINGLQERLRSRFEGGLLADIQPPDLEMKVAILKKKAEMDNTYLPEDVALFIARNVRSNIRDLEGNFLRVKAFASFTNQPITLSLCQKALSDLKEITNGYLTPKEILKTVAHYYGIKVQDLKSKSSAKTYAFPRQVCMWILKKVTDLSYPEIGKLFGNKHHSTVIYSVEKIEEMREKSLELKKALEELLEQFH